MNKVVRREKKTLFGNVVRKIESELSPDKNKLISPDISLDDTTVNEDTAIVQARRDELKASKHVSSDEIIVL